MDPITAAPRLRVATVWLGGCSGCHMSFLDIDERLLDLSSQIELVYSPLVDRKDFPEHVDVTLVEGSVSSDQTSDGGAGKLAVPASFTRALAMGRLARLQWRARSLAG